MSKFRLHISPSIVLLILLNGAFSAFLYGNVMEKALLFDIPSLNSISRTDFPRTMLSNEPSVDLSSDMSKKLGMYGKVVSLKVPRLDVNVDLALPTMYQNVWKISNTKAYLLPYNKSRSGLLGNSLIFSNSDYKVLDLLTMVGEGDRLILTTDKAWDYTYKISKKYVSSVDYVPHILYTSPSKITVIKQIKEKGFTDKNLIIEADFVSVEEQI